MELSITELLTYIRCPFYYRFKYKLDAPTLQIKAIEHWKTCLYVTAINFFKEWYGSRSLPDIKYLQDSWQNIWYPQLDLDVALDFSGSGRKTRQSLGNDGWLNLLHLHKYFSKNPLSLTGIDYPYSIQLGQHTLTGKIDLLTYTTTDQTRLMGIKLCPSSYEASKMYGYNSLEMVAYRKFIGDFLERMYPKANFKKGEAKAELGFFVLENVNNQFYTTHRNDEQEIQLEAIVNSVCKAIEQDIYFPDIGYKCHNCDYKSRCNKGKWIEKKN
jgi:hypothetical protein